VIIRGLLSFLDKLDQYVAALFPSVEYRERAAVLRLSA
jgi:hypothetical protein